MAGTYEGGIKARETNYKNNGKDFYVNIGAIGGRKTMAQGAKPKGFAANRELARTAGKKGGTISRRCNGTKQYVEKNGYFHKLKEMFV